MCDETTITQKNWFTCTFSARQIRSDEAYIICRYDKKEKNKMLPTSMASTQQGRYTHEFDISPKMECKDHEYAKWHEMSRDFQPKLM